MRLTVITPLVLWDYLSLPFAPSTKLLCGYWNAGHPQNAFCTDHTVSPITVTFKYDCGSQKLSCIRITWSAVEAQIVGLGMSGGARELVFPIRSQQMLMVQGPHSHCLQTEQCWYTQGQVLLLCVFSLGSPTFGAQVYEELSCLKCKH